MPWQPGLGRKVWLSPANISGPNQPAQAAIDAALRCDGWEVVHPEKPSMREQLAMFAGAEQRAGEEGSALKGVMFLTVCEGMRPDMLLRDPRQRPDLVHAQSGDDLRAPGGRGIGLRRHWVPREVVT